MQSTADVRIVEAAPSHLSRDIAETNRAPLLSVNQLNVHFQTPRGIARVVDGATFDIHHQEIFGVAGESGSGKTTLVEAILQIIRFPNRITSGSVLFSPDGKQQIDLMKLGPKEMRRFRGEHISYVPQGSMNSLNPVLRIEKQLVDGMIDHGVSPRKAKARIPELLERVGLETRVAKMYPHELSGGMKQRVIIAIAIAMDPELIVADEPTTALDVNVQRKILEALIVLRDELKIALMIVSHDLPVHAQLADRIGIMYAGQIVEAGDIRSVLKTPLHPYADGLMKAIPSIGGKRERIEGISGSTPSPLAWPTGCRFHNRCPHAFEPCPTIPPVLAHLATGERKGLHGPVEVREGRVVACHLYPESMPDGDRS
ncbi:MAG: Oligopeptide transport ATP-binding protein OppD [uncultured Thermomicrobiales bacterium]|uniref:Oligopeptide transport ATP-binding protein OppD n=1 Tax=uncultured Thermomicrobiales bacterium TaxID=1645740 RepID=A0A6J4U3Q7_9BACT|nr:MAG: Oligopeptide transport ATP-binding protein OppD [uncultured Thermomicrobiales bacterium]